jgi:hypothetical protein
MNDQSGTVTPAQGGPEEHGTRLRNNALNLLGTSASHSAQPLRPPRSR